MAFGWIPRGRHLVFGKLDGCPYCEHMAMRIRRFAFDAGIPLVEANVSRGQAYPMPAPGFPSVAYVGEDGRAQSQITGVRSLSELGRWRRTWR